MSVVRIAVLLSGGGRSLQNLLDRGIGVHLVVGNRSDAFGLVRSRAAGIPTVVVTKREHPGPAFSDRIFDECRRANIELVCLAGFLQLLKVPADFAGRVLNIHPSLLPKFGGQGMYGHHVHEAVLAAGETETGCTVHEVDDQYDHGKVLLQRRVPVLINDTPETLADRVFAAECEAYPAAISQWIDQLPSRAM